VGAFPVWRPNLDELDVDSAHASAFLILKSFKRMPLQLSCTGLTRVLACLLSDGPVLKQYCTGPTGFAPAAPVSNTKRRQETNTGNTYSSSVLQ
jgi:hypothetical protein